MNRIIVIILVSHFAIYEGWAQADVTIGPNYKLNLQRQTDNADAYILHNAKVDASSLETFRWETTHPSFGSRGFSFSYLSGIKFFADAVSSSSGTSFTPATRFFISNDGKIGIGTTSPRGKFDVDGTGDIYLSDDPINGSGQSLFVPGHVYLSPYTSGSNVSYIQARRSDNSGTTSIRLRTFNNGSLTESMHIEGNGNVGIGTLSPIAKLEIIGPTTGSGPTIRASGGGDVLMNSGGSLFFDGNYSYASGNYIRSLATNTQAFFTSGSERLRITSSGNIGIGITSPNEKLVVNGTIHSTRVKVDLTVPGPDYVFEKDYNLPSLEEIKNYIDEHKKLPEVPSAKEMEKNGIDVGKMNMILLKKAEELTLYLIELKNENDKLKEITSEVHTLKEQIELIKTSLNENSLKK